MKLDSPNTPARPGRAPRPTEPGKQITQDLLDFVAVASGKKLFPDGLKWIYGARIGYFGANDWARETQQRRTDFPWQIDNIAVDAIEGERASATINYSFGNPKDQRDARLEAALKRERSEKVTLRLAAPAFGGERIWQIVPPDAPPRDPQREEAGESHWLGEIAFALAQKQPAPGASAKAKRSMSHLKRLGLGVIQFVQDWDERFAFAPEYLEEALMPYLRTNQPFSLPVSQETYTFNTHLSDRKLADIAEVARTVLFYEGEGEKPTFRYEGRAAVGFVDGSVRLVSPEEAKALIWKP